MLRPRPCLQAKNLFVYLSPTPYYLNGIVCASNATFLNTGTTPNLINCTQTISNANYVTVAKQLFTGSDALWVYELQVLRAGELIPLPPMGGPASASRPLHESMPLTSLGLHVFAGCARTCTLSHCWLAHTLCQAAPA